MLRERRARVQEARAPRHRADQREASFAGAFSALGELAYGGAQVSASIIDLDSDERILSIDDRIVLPTASVGKILLLIEVSARLSAHGPPALEVLDKTARDAVGDSGLWRHLHARSLPLADVATLVGATSDNLATNVLLREVGLEAVRHRTESLGLMRTALLDLVRVEAAKNGTATSPEQLYMFFGTNEGFIHAVDPKTGVEKFAFIPKELLPNLLPFIFASFVGAVSAGILASVGLQLLGLGPRLTPTLGLMLEESFSSGALVRGLWWWWGAPTLILCLLFIGLFLISVGLDDIANPRLRQARRRASE